MVSEERVGNINRLFPEQGSGRCDQRGPCSISIQGNRNENDVNDRTQTVHDNGAGAFKMRRLAQHYLNGLRIAAFLIRHGFNRMRVRYIIGIYENWIYPVLYRGGKRSCG